MLPNPKTAVRLAQIGDDVASTYINANFIEGYDGGASAYIAAMGYWSFVLV